MGRRRSTEDRDADGGRASPRDRLVCYGELVDACARMVLRQRVVSAKENSQVMGACKLIASVYGIERIDCARDVVAIARSMQLEDDRGDAGGTSGQPE